jgi:hypothetical protein
LWRKIRAGDGTGLLSINTYIDITFLLLAWVVNYSTLREINGCYPLPSVGEWRARDPGHPQGWPMLIGKCGIAGSRYAGVATEFSATVTQ